jgi:GntR family transcriptional regulator
MLIEQLETLKVEWDANRSDVLDRVPLYHQIYTVLKDAIMNGAIAFGDKMPTEQQLVVAFDVSRITAKRALDELAADNLIVRHRGKGSHVTHRWKLSPVKGPLIGMIENMAELFQHSSTKAISIEKITPPAELRIELALDDDEKVHKVVRVHCDEDDEPYAYYVSWTVGIKKGFTRRNMQEHSRLEIIAQSGVGLVRVKQTLSAEPATVKVAAALDVVPGAALLSLTRRSFDDNGRLIDLLHGLYNPKRFKYQMELSLD